MCARESFTRQFTLELTLPMPLAPHLSDALRRGATIIAASPRAARALQLQYADTERAAGHQVWAAPSILDWDSWVRELWRDYAFAHPDAPMLLSPLQERAVWTRQQRDDAALVVSPPSMAILASEAWQRLSDYDAHAARRQSWAANEDLTDAERFRHWAAAFESECARHDWISFSQLAPLLAAAENIALPPEICLVGFDRTTPAQRALLSALAGRGLILNEFVPPSQSAGRTWISAADAQAEISACAAWARDLLIANPAARIGVIVPAIAGQRGPIDRIFRRTLMPASEDIRQPSAAIPWEFSLGHALADIPAIRAALLVLRWVATPLPASEVSWLLLSGFISTTVTNAPAAVRHDAAQRRAEFLRPDRSLSNYTAGLASNRDLHGLHRDLSAFLQTVAANRILDQPRQPSAWSDLIPLLLDRAAWPGERTPDSVQFQALQRWQRLLDDLALLDFDGTVSSFSDFLDQLDHHAAETIFAPESRDAPMQIMGPFESSGQQFDALWFLGADDANWPRRGRFHPLLPPSIQRQYAMPHSTPEDDWNLAHAVTARLLTSAPHMVFSYAQRDKDVELRPSTLIAGLFPRETKPEPASSAGIQEPLNSASLEPIPDDSGTLPWPRERNAGGADVLRRQSACPFQAFAVKRLAAEPLDAVDWGLGPAEKGKVLHAILEHLFSRSFPTHAELVTVIATNQLGPALDAAIDTVLAEYRSPDPWQQSYLAAEKRRLQARLQEWLDCEAKRHPFAVEACEQRLPDVHVGGLRMKLRADRIDRLDDDTRLLIDYKSGEVSAADWRGERPDEPQLPLYAAFGNVQNLSGVVFAKIRAGKTGFDGRVRDARAQLRPDLSATSRLVTDPYTEAMRDGWARVLENLADQFLAGEASVDPREPKVCEQCDLHGLCRIAELALANSGDGNGEGPDA
jgi:ATP-dependent helicase/nuclease subunit B